MEIPVLNGFRGINHSHLSARTERFPRKIHPIRPTWLENNSFAQVGIYDPPRPLVPKVIWSYWENVHQAGCFWIFVGRGDIGVS